MLDVHLEKQNDEKLIFKKEVSVKVALISPFESSEDIVLSGDILKGEVELCPHSEATITQYNEEFGNTIKKNQLENALKESNKFPNNPFLLNNLGLAYLDNKEIESAFKVFKLAIEKKPDYTPVALNLASLYVVQKDYDSAMGIYENLLENNPNDTRVLINIGSVYFKKKEFQKAKAVYTKIIKLEPKNITSRNRLALLNLITGKFREAIAELRKCLRINNDLPSIYNNLGIAYNVLGASKKALQAFKTALKIFPYYTSATFNLALTLKQQDISMAIDVLEDYLERTETLQIRELLARFYFESNKPQRAYKNLLKVLLIAKQSGASDQEVAILHNNIGVIVHSIRDFEKAEKNYFACINSVGYINDVMVGNIIDLYFDWHKLDTAKKYIDVFHDSFGEQGFYLYYLSKHSAYTDNVSASVKLMEKFLLTNEKFSPAYSFLSNMYSEYLHDYQKAIKSNEKGHRNLPENKGIINNLAYSYLMNNEIEKAENTLNKVEHVTNNVFLIATRGLLNIKKENLEEGKRLYALAAGIAKSETFKQKVTQKKHLEVAKYYLLHNQKDKAKSSLKKAFSVKTKGGQTIFMEQAKKLYEGIK